MVRGEYCGEYLCLCVRVLCGQVSLRSLHLQQHVVVAAAALYLWVLIERATCNVRLQLIASARLKIAQLQTRVCHNLVLSLIER